jgi:Protein of unknown function (DUF3103)
MKKSFVRVVFTTFICGIVFIGCKDEGKNEVVDPQSNVVNDEILIPSTAKVFDEKSARLSYLDGMEDYEEFAKMLALSLKDKNMRKFLKDEASKKFDGDYDILVAKVQDNLISGAKFGEHLKKNEKKANSYVEVLKNEKLNISIPIEIEKWDLNKQVLVAVALGANEKTTQNLKAFDSNGKIYLINAKTDPNQPVIVIGNNERIGFVSSKNTIKKGRTSGYFETVSYAKVKDLSAIEKWWNGGPEIKFDGAVYFDGSFTIQSAYNDKYWRPSRSGSTSGENLNLQLFQWFFDTYQGPAYHAQVFEEDDSNSTSTFSVGVTAGKKDTITGTANYTYTYKAASERMVGELLSYNGQSPRTISDAIFTYTIINTAP